MTSHVWKLVTQNHLWRLLIAVVVIGGVSLFLFSSPALAASPHPGTNSPGFKFHKLQGSPSSTSTDTGTTQVFVIPQDDILCIGVSMTLTNPGEGYIYVAETIKNNCGSPITEIDWSWWTTVVCNGVTYSGPSDAADLGSLVLASGASTTPYSGYWSATCSGTSFPYLPVSYQILGGAGALARWTGTTTQNLTGETGTGWKTFI